MFMYTMTGPNTNGSQFFITFRSTPHLNGKHVVFGRLLEGLQILRNIEVLRTGANNKPVQDVWITNCGMAGEPDDKDSNLKNKSTKAATLNVAQSNVNTEEIDLDDDSDDSDEQDEDDTPAQTDAADIPAPVPTFSNPKAAKLFELRLKLNKSRKANQRESIAERKRLNGNGKDANAQAHSDFRGKKEAWEQELRDQGENPDHGWLHENAESAGATLKKAKKKKKGAAAFGWDVFNADAKYKAYKKRLGSLDQSENVNLFFLTHLLLFHSIYMPCIHMCEIEFLCFVFLWHTLVYSTCFLSE